MKVKLGTLNAFVSDTGKLFANVQMLLQLFTRCSMVQSWALAPTRNSPTYLGVAKLRCRRTMDCTGSRSETVFSLCRLLKSCISYKFSIFIAFLFSLLLFLSKLPSGIKQTRDKNRPILHSPPASPELCQRKRSLL